MADGDVVDADQLLARREVDGETQDGARSRRWHRLDSEEGLRIAGEDVVEREYPIPHNAKLMVENGQRSGPATPSPTAPSTLRSTSRPAGARRCSATSSRRSSASTAARA